MKDLLKEMAIIAFGLAKVVLLMIAFFVTCALALCGWKLIEALTQKLF